MRHPPVEIARIGAKSKGAEAAQPLTHRDSSSPTVRQTAWPAACYSCSRRLEQEIMSTPKAVFVGSPSDVTADMNDVKGSASAEHPESSSRVIRVSLFGGSFEIAESTGAMPFFILGC
jgi:hypothetical protein